MGHVLQRFGIRVSRGWALLFLLIGVILLAAYWLGPLRPEPARLELLAVSGDVAVDDVRATPLGRFEGASVFAIPLAARNVGAAPAHARRLVLSVPGHYRLSTRSGRLRAEVTPGVPLYRYVIDLPASELRPGVRTESLPGLDTLFIEANLPSWYCRLQGMQIPEFQPAPELDVSTLSDLRIFYSFTTQRRDERHTGLIDVQLDPSLLQVTPVGMPPVFRTEIETPEARVPPLGTLLFVGARGAYCGDPEQPVELFTSTWENRAGARLYMIYVDGQVRKRLYDLSGDGIIDLETWDADGDGWFEARRQASYPVPDFLVPLPPRDPQMVAPDPQRPDSAWLAMFHSTGAGIDRFTRHAEMMQLAARQRAADSIAAAQQALAIADGDTATVTAPPATIDHFPELGPVAPATPEFLALFNDVAAGPFRFSRREQPQPAPEQPPVAQPAPAPAAAGPQQPAAQPTAPAQPQPAQPVTPAAPDTAAPATEPAETPPRPRRPPIGTPVGNQER